MRILRHWDGIEDFVDDHVGGDVFGLGFVGEDDAVAEDVVDDFLDVLRGGVGAALEEGVAAGGEVECERGARRGPV